MSLHALLHSHRTCSSSLSWIFKLFSQYFMNDFKSPNTISPATYTNLYYVFVHQHQCCICVYFSARESERDNTGSVQDLKTPLLKTTICLSPQSLKLLPLFTNSLPVSCTLHHWWKWEQSCLSFLNIACMYTTVEAMSASLLILANLTLN